MEFGKQGVYFSYGDLGIGKTTLVNALADILGDNILFCTGTRSLFGEAGLFKFVGKCF